MSQPIEVRVEIFREGDLYVGVCPDLDVSSFGETVEEAKQSLQEALSAFIEECEAMGTLEEVLEESGFVCQNGSWISRQPISSELVAIG
ncbi:type II toxin-antitoxin system HicB family antitoxin [Capilliphycus salinus ALCB114379]|uniref:type II toxin-antitoxin system HicB family antitoxin n=1 Tax=Capilliphycus salinus TaxID=2768948 RepID=UPI0039A4A652